MTVRCVNCQARLHVTPPRRFRHVWNKLRHIHDGRWRQVERFANRFRAIQNQQQPLNDIARIGEFLIKRFAFAITREEQWLIRRGKWFENLDRFQNLRIGRIHSFQIAQPTVDEKEPVGEKAVGVN